MQLDVAYDTRWIGKTLSIFNMQGQIIMQVMIRSTSQQIDIRRLQAGSYILIGKKEDGEMIRIRFVKL